MQKEREVGIKKQGIITNNIAAKNKDISPIDSDKTALKKEQITSELDGKVYEMNNIYWYYSPIVSNFCYKTMLYYFKTDMI